MIGVSGKDRGCAVQLFRQHGPRQQVRPCRFAECEEKVGAAPVRLAMTIRGTQNEAAFAHPVVAPPPECFGQLL